MSLSIENDDELHLSGTPTTAETADFTDSVDSADSQTATSVQSVVVAPSLSSYLDGLAVQPLAVLSLRKLISTATVAIRVRRSSDNAEQDIGFDGETLDTAALSTFAGSSSAYVTKVYDQKGSFDAVQATSSKQPRIVNAGTYDGKIVFNGTSNYLSIASLTMGTPYIALFSKLNYGTWGAYRVQFELSSDGVATSGGFAWYVDNTGTQYVIGGGTGRSNIASVIADSLAHQITAYANRTESPPAVQTYLRLDGAPVATSAGNTSTLTGNFSTYPLYIGARAGTSLFSNFKLESVAIYTADTTSIMSEIESIVG